MTRFTTGDLKYNPDLLIGKKLGKYEVKERLGMGSIGTVFKVWDTLEESYKCLKVIPPHIISEKLSLKDLRRELKTAAKIKHESVVKVYGLDEKDDFYFIFFKYISPFSPVAE